MLQPNTVPRGKPSVPGRGCAAQPALYRRFTPIPPAPARTPGGAPELEKEMIRKVNLHFVMIEGPAVSWPPAAGPVRCPVRGG